MRDGLELIPLYSSSGGNSTLIKCNGSCFLIDCGKNCKQTEAALMSVGVLPDDIDCIFVTHGHGDHIAGAIHPCTTYQLRNMGRKASKATNILRNETNSTISTNKADIISVMLKSSRTKVTILPV